jgi:cysteine desulfurase
MEINVEKLGADLVTFDSSKVYGPHGIGCLYVKRNTPIEQIIYGGGQESGLRSGTENLSAIMGFAKALEILAIEQKNSSNNVENFRQIMIAGLRNIKAGIKINGSGQNSQTQLQSPNILNVSIPDIDNEFFVLQLDAKGIACSTKSSCLRDEDESYVLKAIGADSKTSVRFSFGRWTTHGEIKRALKIIKLILSKTTSLS